MFSEDPKQNVRLQKQRQAHLVEAANAAQATAAMRELASKDRKHRLRALVRSLIPGRARNRA